jgi:hypothetical protein
VYSSKDFCNNCSNETGSVYLRATDDVDLVLDYKVVYVINRDQVVELFKAWRYRYQDDFVIPQSKRITKDVASYYSSDEIALYKKVGIDQEIFNQLESLFLENYLILLEYEIADIRLDE